MLIMDRTSILFRKFSALLLLLLLLLLNVKNLPIILVANSCFVKFLRCNFGSSYIMGNFGKVWYCWIMMHSSCFFLDTDCPKFRATLLSFLCFLKIIWLWVASGIWNWYHIMYRNIMEWLKNYMLVRHGVSLLTFWEGKVIKGKETVNMINKFYYKQQVSNIWALAICLV